MNEPLNITYDSEDYEEFCERQKYKGLRKEFWHELPAMYMEELEFRAELEGSLERFSDLFKGK